MGMIINASADGIASSKNSSVPHHLNTRIHCMYGQDAKPAKPGAAATNPLQLGRVVRQRIF